MAEGKNSFVLYADYIHTFNLLNNEQAGKLIKHLLAYVNDQNPVFEDNEILLKLAFEPIKRQLKRDLREWESIRQKRSESGHLGGVKSAESRKRKQNEANEANASKPKQSSSKSKQTQANQAVTVNVNDTVTVNDTISDTKVSHSSSDELQEKTTSKIGIKKSELNIPISKKKKFRPKKESEWPQKLFNNIKTEWWMWYMKRNNNQSPKFDAGSAKAIDHIRNYLIREGKKKEYAEESMIYDFGIEQFKLLLSRWEELKTNNFLYTSVDIKKINSNLNEIINFYNNGSKEYFRNNTNSNKPSASDTRVNAIANWSLGFLKDGDS